MKIAKYFIAVGCIVFIGILSEVIQLFIETRIFSLMDIWWNIVAAIVGALFYLIYIVIKQFVVTSD